MKKVFVLFTVIMLVSILSFSLVACGGDDVDALRQTVEELKSQITELQNNSGATNIQDLKSQIETLKNNLSDSNSQIADLEKDIASLETRVKKLETSVSLISTLDKRISALENGGADAQGYAQLKSQVEALQATLTDNSASDSEVKSQVTEMQLVLNTIYGSDGSDGVLEEIQSSLNTLYGEVDRVQQFENGKEYEVKLNGVVYYTVSVIVEYHDGIVQSEQDIIECKGTNIHWCGSITIKNKSFTTITTTNLSGFAKYIVDDLTTGPIMATSKNGSILSDDEAKVKHNETIKWYFVIGFNDNLPKNNLKIWFTLPQDYNIRLLILDNVWDGVQEPIQGVKS